MSIKLKGSTDGSVTLQAPADTSPTGTDKTLTLPTTTGSANQFVKNGGTAGELEYSSMVETSTGIGIGGVTSPFDKLQVRTATDCNFILSSAGGTEASLEIFNNAGSSNTPLNYRASKHKFKIQADEKMRLDSSGRLAIGTTSAMTDAQLTLAAPLDVALGFKRTDSAKFDAGIKVSDGHMTFHTGSNSATVGGISERLRIDSSGNLLVGKTAQNLNTAGFQVRGDVLGLTQITRIAGSVLDLNRNTNDGVIVNIRQNTNIEGTISVSGSTVSYNGAHLSRWSQLAGGAERIEILRGSVLSNLDEMCEWGEENNEQLNRMKVSDVEGDVNVSGVFQAWDDDDDTYINDFYCAMTGDFVIRIAQGTTVARGDLLMSAGDGTAKPQDDDIVRSKTIAKVTSTTVSTTYSDGSYCVPCVLMAC